MTDVFVSYARADEPQAERVAEALRAEGYQVWRDSELPAHRAYADVIEERLKSVVSELEKLPDAILFIDEIHTVIGAGATSGGAMDASNLAFAVGEGRGGCRAIGRHARAGHPRRSPSADAVQSDSMCRSQALERQL